MGAPCSKMVHRDLVPPQVRAERDRGVKAWRAKPQCVDGGRLITVIVGGARLTYHPRNIHHQPHTQRRDLKANAKQQPNPTVDAACPIHGSQAHTHVPAPASTRRLQTNGVPMSPVLTTTGGGLALQTPGGRAGALPAEEDQQLQQQPMSTYMRAKRGNIRKSGLQLLHPARAYVVGQPVTLKVRIERDGGGLIVSRCGVVWWSVEDPVDNATDRVPIYVYETQVEIRNAQSRPLAGATLLLLDNGYFAEASLVLPEVRVTCALVGGWAVHHLVRRISHG